MGFEPKWEWAEPDLNRRPLACKANVLTKLDDRPLLLRFSRLDLRCLIKRLHWLILEFCFFACWFCGLWVGWGNFKC
jgi:hypothetical protein